MEEKPETTPVIIIVDDDPDDRFLAQLAFKEIGFHGELKLMEDGEALMHYLLRISIDDDHNSSQLPNLILLDLNMPNKNGYETLQEMKNIAELSYTTVVIWTTAIGDDDKKECYRMGADMFLTKPTSYTDLLKNLRYLVEIYCSNSGNSYSLHENLKQGEVGRVKRMNLGS